jgi:hypothetical protein
MLTAPFAAPPAGARRGACLSPSRVPIRVSEHVGLVDLFVFRGWVLFRPQLHGTMQSVVPFFLLYSFSLLYRNWKLLADRLYAMLSSTYHSKSPLVSKKVDLGKARVRVAKSPLQLGF